MSTNTQVPVRGIVMPSVRVTRLVFPFDGEVARLADCKEAAERTQCHHTRTHATHHCPRQGHLHIRTYNELKFSNTRTTNTLTYIRTHCIYVIYRCTYI